MTRAIKCATCVRRDALVSALYWLDTEEPVSDGEEPMTMDEVLLCRATPCEHTGTKHDGDEKTLNEVADLLGLSRERIRQIETQLLAKLERNRTLRCHAGVGDDTLPPKAVANAMRLVGYKRPSGVRQVWHARGGKPEGKLPGPWSTGASPDLGAAQGRRGFLCIAMAVTVDGVGYPSQSAACAAVGCSKGKMIDMVREHGRVLTGEMLRDRRRQSASARATRGGG